MASRGLEDDDQCLGEYQYRYQKDLLDGKVAVITGGGSGIGFRITELFMRHGCRTVITSRNVKKLKQSAERLERATGTRCIPLQADVRKFDDVFTVMKKAVDEFGNIDILVNAAAGNFLCPVSGMSTNAFRTVLMIDTVGTFNSTKASYEACMKDRGGIIINITATLHYTGVPYQAHAGSAKAAIDALTRHLAVEWGPQGIRVNCVAPGPIEGTVGFNKLGGADQEAVEHLTACIPLQRIGTRTEIAESCLFLASPVSSLITGVVLVADGGAWMVNSTARRPSKL